MSQWELKENPTCLKRGKTRATKSWLVLVLQLSVESFLDESQREVRQKQSNAGLLSTLSWKLL